jgi:hypothetical protein
MGIGEIARTMNFVESIVEDAAVNDTLLPKLISGELRVKDARRIVGRIAM